VTDTPTIRLQKRMAQLGIASRRASEKMILAGRVKVNGKLQDVLGTKVSLTDSIEVDGSPVEAIAPLYVLLHKPMGTLCTTTDPRGRSTIYELLGEELPFLAHVGRLDYNTEGLLLLTNDGDLAQSLLRPEYAIARVYEVKIRGRLSKEDRMKIETGISLDGRPTKPVILEKMQSKSKHDWLQLTLVEGKNRHIHRIFKAVGTSVTRLRRVSFATLTIDGLEPGEYRLLKAREVSALRDMIQ
jgi:23S rRNA pseudouridine2605 synthase